MLSYWLLKIAFNCTYFQLNFLPVLNIFAIFDLFYIRISLVFYIYYFYTDNITARADNNSTAIVFVIYDCAIVISIFIVTFPPIFIPHLPHLYLTFSHLIHCCCFLLFTIVSSYLFSSNSNQYKACKYHNISLEISNIKLKNGSNLNNISIHHFLFKLSLFSALYCLFLTLYYCIY